MFSTCYCFSLLSSPFVPTNNCFTSRSNLNGSESLSLGPTKCSCIARAPRGESSESSSRGNIAYLASQVKHRHGWGSGKCSDLSSRAGVTDIHKHTLRLGTGRQTLTIIPPTNIRQVHTIPTKQRFMYVHTHTHVRTTPPNKGEHARTRMLTCTKCILNN